MLTQNGYLVGAPSYLAVGKLSLCRPLAGELRRPPFPQALATPAAQRWRGRAAVFLMFAGIHAGVGDAVACTGMLSGAVLSAAHARLAERRQWRSTRSAS